MTVLEQLEQCLRCELIRMSLFSTTTNNGVVIIYHTPLKVYIIKYNRCMLMYLGPQAALASLLSDGLNLCALCPSH